MKSKILTLIKRLSIYKRREVHNQQLQTITRCECKYRKYNIELY